MKNYKVVKYLSLTGFKIVYLSMLQNLYGMSECQLSMLKQNVPAPPLEMQQAQIYLRKKFGLIHIAKHCIYVKVLHNKRSQDKKDVGDKVTTWPSAISAES